MIDQLLLFDVQPDPMTCKSCVFFTRTGSHSGWCSKKRYLVDMKKNKCNKFIEKAKDEN